MDVDRGTLRTKAEENFRAEYGHHPIRVELPESPSDPQLDALIARWSRRGQPPTLKAIDGRHGRLA